MEMSKGVSLLRTVQSLLTGRTIQLVYPLPTGCFACFCRLRIFLIQLFRKIISGIHQCVKQFGSRSGLRFVGPNCLHRVSADGTSRQRINDVHR